MASQPTPAAGPLFWHTHFTTQDGTKSLFLQSRSSQSTPSTLSCSLFSSCYKIAKVIYVQTSYVSISSLDSSLLPLSFYRRGFCLALWFDCLTILRAMSVWSDGITTTRISVNSQCRHHVSLPPLSIHYTTDLWLSRFGEKDNPRTTGDHRFY